MSWNIKIWLGIIGVVLTIQLNAQKEAPQGLSIDEAYAMALKGNHQLRQAQLDLRVIESEVRSTKSYGQPQIHASIGESITNMPMNTFGSKLQQGIIQQSDFLPELLNNPSAISNMQTQISVRQAILNPEIKPLKEAILYKRQASESSIGSRENYLRYQINIAYMGLQMAYEGESVLLKAKKTAEVSLKLVEDNVKEGYLQKVDILSVTLRLNEVKNQLHEVRSSIQNASDQLSWLMGSSLGVQYVPSETMYLNEQREIITDTISMEISDIKAMEYQILAQKKMLTSIEKSQLPKINAMGSYELNNPLDFKGSQHGFFVMVQATWKIFDGNRKKYSLEKGELEIEKNRTNLNQILAQKKLELEYNKRIVQEATNKIDLAKSAIEYSEEILRIKKNRFEEGLEKTADLLLAETEVAQKEMNYVNAVYQYNLALAKINFLLEKE